MQSSSDAIFNAAMQLPEDKRLALVFRLMDTLPPEDLTLSMDDPRLFEELDRRSKDLEGAVAWSELEAED